MAINRGSIGRDMSDSLAPVVLFVYNRPVHTRRTLEALEKNVLSDQTRVIIFADGAKPGASPETVSTILETRSIIREDWSFKLLEIYESESNQGLAKSIIEGVTSIINEYGKVIVLEDDIVTGLHFLEYMNQALDHYRDEPKVWHISGWTYPVKSNRFEEAFFWKTMNCWGWATWADRWQHYHKDVNYLVRKFSAQDIWAFNVKGAEDFWQQVLDNRDRKIDTWAIFWYATIFINNGLCLSPYRSLVQNIGLDGSGVHCGESPADTIVEAIDHKVVDFPLHCKMNKRQFHRLRRYLQWRHSPDPIYKIKDSAKAVLRCLGLFEWVRRIRLRRRAKSRL